PGRRDIAGHAGAAGLGSLHRGALEDRRPWCRGPRRAILGVARPPEPARRRKGRAATNRERGETAMNVRLLALLLVVMACTGQGAAPPAGAQTATRAKDLAAAAADRKSTRLNSSHVKT